MDHVGCMGTQALYGIIQGGVYEDLRIESCEFVNSQEFFGAAIGGSLGATKKDMHDIVGFTRKCLRDDRPVHLLGIGGVRGEHNCDCNNRKAARSNTKYLYLGVNIYLTKESAAQNDY